MNQPNPELVPGNAKVFVACLLSFAILITPIAAIATPRTRINPTANEKNAVPAERKEATEASLALDPAPAAVPEPAPVPPPAAPVIVATLTDNRPSVDPASAKPGDTINYTVTIQNTGDADATGVQFNQNIDTHSLYVTNSGLLAMADSYNTIGGVNINVPAPGLLTNDLDISAGTNAGMTTTAQTVSSTQCAACNNVTINGDGSFTYDPKAGFTGTDTFTYAAKNAANKTAMATVQVTVAGKIWFIKNSGAAGGACSSSCDGRLSHPFQTLAAFNTANGSVGGPAAGDSVFIFESTTDYTGPVTFLNNQKFVGQDATASLISITGLTQPSGTDPLPAMNFTPATNVNITSASSAITLGQGNTLRGFTVGTTTGTKIVGNNFGTLIVGNSSTPDVTLNGAGQALNLTTGTLSVTGGFVSVTSTSSTAQGINLAGIADSDGAGGSSFSFGSTTVSGASSQGILIGTTTADLNFGNTSVTGGSDAISFQNNSSGTRTFGTLGATAGTGFAINHAVGGGNVTVTGLATLTSNAGNTIDIQTQAVSTTVDFAGGATLTKTAGGTGINLVNDNGTVTFGGTLTIGTSGVRFPATAVTISGGAGPTFSTGIVNLGAVSIFTNAFAGITSTNNDGTINSTSGTVDTGAAIALSIDGPAGLTTLGMTLTTVNSTGGTNNISLIDDAGTLTVNGGAMSGATVASFSVNAGTVSATYSGNITQAGAAAMVNISGAHTTGTITFNTGTLSATNGTGLQFNNADGTYNFNGTTTLTNGSRIDILNGSSGSFGFTSGASVTNGGGTASFNVSDSNPGVAYAGTITTNTLRPVSISNALVAACGTQTFSGAIGSTANGILVNNCNAGTITFSAAKTLNTATNSAVTLTTNAGATINFTGGGLNIDTTTAIGFNATGGGIINVTGSANDIDSTTSTALLLNGVTVGGSGMAFNTVNKTATGGAFEGINIDGLLNTGGGTLTVASSTIAGTAATSGKAGIDIATSSAPITFTTVAINATDGPGIALTNNTAAIAVNGGTVGGTTSTTGNAVDIDQGTAGITVAAALTKSTAGRIVEITGRTGTSTIDITGSLNCSSTCTGINVQNINAGASTINFSSGTKNLDTTGGAGAGVTLDNIDNATVNFSNGGLNIDTASGVGFNAINGATAINVTGSGNSINSTSAIALNVVSSTIGGSNLNFHDISAGNNTAAADPASGIVLDTTGSGRLIISGSGNAAVGGDNSGGEIQHTTGHAVSLNSTLNPSFTNMNIHDIGRSGVDGNSVTDFTFKNGKIDNVGTAAVGQYDESNISFNDNGAFTSSSLIGTVSITQNQLTNARRNGIQIENGTGTISNLTITNNTLTSSTNSAVSLGTAIKIMIQGSVSTTAHLTTGTISGNTILNFPSAEGIAVLGGSGNSTNNTSATLGANGTPINITNNRVSGQAAAGQHVGQNAIHVSINSQVGVMNVNISCNGNTAAPCSASGTITNIEGQGVTVFAGGTITGTATIDRNVIVSNQTLGSGQAGVAMQVDDGPAGSLTSAADYNAIITNNNVSGNDGNGIRAIARNSLGKLDVTIQNNTIAAPTLANRNGIRVDAGSSAGDVTLCMLMTGNTSAGSGINRGIGIRKQGTVVGTNDFGITGLAPSPATGPQAEAKVTADNPAGNLVDVLSGSNFVNCAVSARNNAPQNHPRDYNARVNNPVPERNLNSLLAFSNVKADHAEILNDFNRSLTIHSDAVDANGGQQSLLAKARVEAGVGQPALLNASVEAGIGQPVLANARVEASIGQRATLANVRVEAERGPAPAVPPSLIARAAASLSRVANSFDSLIVPSAHAEESEGSKPKSAGSKRSDVRLNHARSVRTNRAATASNALAPVPVGCSAAPGTICVNVGILHPGDSVQIGFSVTVNNPPNLTLLTPSPHISTQGAISGGNFATVQTNDPDTVAAGDPTDTPIDLFDVNVALGSSLNPSTPSDAVTYTATITVPAQVPAPLGGANPSSGTVTFKDNNATISVACTNVALSGSGPWTAQCTVPAGTYTGATSHPITATYNGNGNFDQNTSSILTQSVLQCTNTVTVTNTGDNGGIDPAFGAGTGTLRQAIVDVCPGGTINFNIPGGGPDTITLGAGLILSKDVTINGPTAKTTIINGAGLYRVFSIGSGKTVSISNLQMTAGSASATGGAGILNSGTLTLKNSTVSGSTTTGVDGGGIRNEGTLTVISSTISGNTAANDGGGISQSATATGMTLINTTVSGNNAAGSGGGVDVLGGTMTSINSTITGNRADSDNNSAGSGGGLRRQGGTATLHNTIVAGNFNEDGAVDSADDIAGTVDTASSFNLIGDSATAGGLQDKSVDALHANIVGNAGAGTIDITTVLNTTLANNGGPTQTHALVGTGPAVEAGSNANLPADTFDLDGDANIAETLPVDQRGLGFPRTADSADADTTQTVDIGAYEAHPTIEDITQKTTAEDTALPGFVFNIGDGTGALITSVTATSSNTTVVPNLPANISVTGAGATRTLNITPVANTNTVADGAVVITVTVTATNGRTALDTFNFVVTEVNDAPVPTNDSLTAVDEDSGQRLIPFADLLGNDINKGAPNETGQTLTVSAVSNPAGGTVVLDTPNSRVLFTPAADFSGTASFDYQVTDNGTTNGVLDAKSGTASASFTVNAINDPPSFTIAGNPAAVNEDAGAQTVNSFATSISQGPGESGQLPLTFNISPTGTTGNISFASGPAINATTGNLTFTTNADTNGTATFSVTLSDSGPNAPPPNSNTSLAQSFTITVNAVNDPPNFLLGPNPSADEDAGLQTVPGFANSFQPGPVTATDEGTQTLVGYTVTQTGGTLTFSSGPAIDNSGNLTYTSAANANGTATFNVVATDSGSGVAPNVNQSAPSSFTITVNAVNDAPSFVKGADQTSNKNAGAQTVTNWATAISAGPPDEVTAGQTVSFNVSVTGTTGSLAFTSLPAVSSSGTLTYTATNGTSGTATVDVKAVDSGSGVAPNQNESAVQTFTITVTGVNVAPVNTVPASVTIPQDVVYTFGGAAISVADVDAAETDNVISVALNATNGTMDLSGTAGLTFTGGSNGSAAMTVEGTIPNLNAALNNMRFTPTPGYTGAASIQMVSNDLGKTGTGGAQSDDDTINITVTAGAAMYINEVLFNPPGTDAPNEYIEIRGVANTTIPAGTYLVAIEGDAADNPGDVQTIINLSGLSFGSNGFLVLLQNGNTYTTDAGATVLTSTTPGFGGLPGAIFQADGGATDIEDASVTFMLIQTGVAPTLTDDIDVNDDGLTDGFVFAGWNVRDSISAMNGSANARAYGAFSFRNSAGSGTSVGPEVIVNFIPSYVGRIGDSTGSTAADWVASGVLGGLAPNWTLGVAAETEPASFAGKPLNHIGASNFTNQAPVNSVPAATQNVNEDFVLTFNAGNANLISISDPDAGGADVKVTLTATNGTMSLSGTAGLTFTPAGANNDGVNDTQMIFTGTIANINTALNGMTFTPTLDYFGGATIQIVTDDQGNVGVGGAKTDTDTVNINVNAVNDPPSFALAGSPAAVNEDAGGQTVNGFASSISQGPGESGQTPLTFNLSPAGTTGNITFASGPAIDGTTGNLTYTTNADTNGTATFNVTLSDSGSNVAPNSNTSGTQQFTITVNAVNDAPSFLIPSSPPSVNEDAGAQTVNSFATTFQPGPPAATDEIGQTLVGYTLTPTGTTGNLTFTSAPSISNAGTLTYTPTGDTSGTASFNVVATDSGSGSAPNVNQSAPVAFTITVNAQNDAPVMDNTGNMSLAAINEDVPNGSNPGTLVSDVILSAGGDRITDIDAGAVEGIAVIAVANTNGTWQYSIDNGTNWLPFGTPDSLNSRLLASNATTRVRFIPNLNFNGTVDPGLTFRAWDQTSGANGNTADTSVPGNTTAFSTATETASITVNPVNDTPTTTGIPAVTVNEDAANTVLNLRLSFNDVEDGNDLAYTVQANTNPSLFSSVSINNANDNLTLAYAANAFGSAQITIRGTDVGSLFVESTFTVTVNSSNDPPTFTKGVDQTTFQNSGPQTVANWATNMSPGPADESGQTLTFNVTGNTNAALFSAGPAINATTGTLTYTGANNASGNATITITLSDNGGTANGGNDTSAPQNFVITITPCVNPATVINTNDSGVGSLRDAITNVCTGGTINFDPALNGQTITLTSGELAINKSLTINGPGANLLTISGNNASRIFNIGNTFTVGISGLTMSNGRVNTATSEGGAIQNNGTLTITGSTISGNTVNGSGITVGGGISNKTTGNLTLRDSTISGNSATGGSSNNGGGIYNRGVATVINSTISGNSATGAAGLGGGLCMDPVSGTASIINSTVSGNSASVAGGGLHATGTVNVRNTIVAGNTSPTSPDVRNAFVSQGNNLIGANDGSTGFTNGVNNDKVGTVASPLNALLAPLGNYGGPTQTHALLPGSPAIDAANNCVTDAAHCGDANIPQLTTDQRGAGFNRLVNTTVDIGAFESRGFTIAITSGNLQSAVFNTAFGAPLVATVSSGAGEPVNGGQVTFTAPGSGASATFTGGVTTIASAINAGGQATASATANATVGGPYNVPATGSGITGTANFSLTNIKANQTINFGALANKTFGDPDFGISATATSGLPVGFTPSGQCTVTSPSPGTVHITGAGSCTITASQGGDANYNMATNVPQSFTIAQAATNTAVSSSVNPSDLNQSVTFTATVTSGAGTPTGTVQFKDNATNLGAPVALNASGVAQFTTSALTTGTHTITADYNGDANFTASTGSLSGGQVVKAQPSLSINDVSVTEGDAGTKLLNFTVTLSAASSLTVTTNYATANNTATAPSDYVAIPSTLLTFNPGDTSKNVSVTINGDTGFEPDETFFVNLSNAVNATISDNQGLGTIQNDDALGGFISFSQPNYNVSESTGIVTVTVTRTNDVSQAAQVDYATDDTGASISCAALNTGLASQRCDYTSMFGTLKFAANETQKTVDIPINLDGYTEGPEVFTFNLSNATGGAVLIASTATVTISDSASPTPNANDDTSSFVRQLYHDFLNRDADAAGLAFWKNNIDKCNDPAQRPAGQTLAACIEVQRITTMAAFFLSIEFKQTGGMVRDFYVAALDRPLSNNMPGFVEFMRDTQAIQKGVTVGQGNWQQVLDANRLAFMNEFVMRAEFVALYPTTDTPTQYVDKLYLHANLTQTQQERLDAIEYFGGAATAADPGARARALLLLTQNGNFQVRETRRAFVHMQYLGFLRRSPNDAPDNNFDGFNFWVTKLNQFNGDYLQAEMVKAFLTSLEYRRRFGP